MGAETIERRRWALALVTLGLIVVVAVAIALATSGGGGSGGSPAAVETTPPTSTLPATTPTTATPTTATPTTAQTTTPTPEQSRPTSRVTIPAGGTLSEGDNGSAVTALQKALAALKYDVGTPDGDFGPATKAAVVAFQDANGLTPDGIVGTNTVKKLNAALAAAGF